jgi:hypothetical protein
MNPLASALQAIATPEAWTGTASELAVALNASGLHPSITTARLSTELRRYEPQLWWTHQLSVRFSRTNKRRLIHLARRESVR